MFLTSRQRRPLPLPKYQSSLSEFHIGAPHFIPVRLSRIATLFPRSDRCLSIHTSNIAPGGVEDVSYPLDPPALHRALDRLETAHVEQHLVQRDRVGRLPECGA